MLKSLVKRQEDHEVKAIYGSGPYRLSQPFKRFAIDSIKWHNMNPQKRIKHVEQFRKYNPKLEDHFVKPALSGRKAHEKKRVRKSEAEIIVDRLENLEKIQIEDPSAPRKIVYELHLRSKVPRKVERCQGNCRVKLWPADESNNDYLLVKSFGTSQFMVKKNLVSNTVHSTSIFKVIV